MEGRTTTAKENWGRLDADPWVMALKKLDAILVPALSLQV